MIENTLERIAVALEKIAASLPATGQTPAAPPNPLPAASATIPAAPPGPTSVPPGPGMPAQAPGAPPNAPGAPAPGVPQVPGAVPPAAAPLQGVPTLDDLRAAFNDFARANSGKIADAYALVTAQGAQSLDTLSPAAYPTVLSQLKALGG